jgi:outer membrane protein assembly factor BamD
MRKLILFSTASLFLSLLPGTRAALTYKRDEGWNYSATDDETPAAKNAKEQLARAQEFEKNGDTDKAIKAYRVFVKKFAFAKDAPNAQLKIGDLLEQIGDHDHAFDAYGEYIKKYPRGEFFDKAVEAQFNIAKRFLDGERVRMYGIKTFASMDRTQKMFSQIVEKAAYSKYAPLSQFNIGLAFEKQGKFNEAIEAYKTVLVKYPNDPIAADAQYQIGYAYQKQTREGTYDPGLSTKAREAYEDFNARFPNSEKVKQANENIKVLSGGQTRSSYEIAKFYDKQKQYKAAVIYYNEVIKQQPGTAEAEASKARIEALKGQVGEDALHGGPERTETGARAKQRRALQAQVDTASRPDYVGPPVTLPAEAAAAKPKLRTSSKDIGPVQPDGAPEPAPAPPMPAVEPPLPAQ